MTLFDSDVLIWMLRGNAAAASQINDEWVRDLSGLPIILLPQTKRGRIVSNTNGYFHPLPMDTF